MSKNYPSFVEDINVIIRESENLLVIARCTELQRRAIASLEDLRPRLADLKRGAIAERDENTANVLLGYECAANMIISELEMCVLLKEENPDAAWDKLVSAQMSCIGAIRAHEGFSHLVYHYQRFETIEQVVFPPQIFVSSGFIVSRQECSICGLEYEDCEHLIGKPYMGAFCSVIAKDIELDHVAIVENPSDKGCRIREFEVEGGVRNRMTWRVEKRDTGNDEVPDGQARGGTTIFRTGQ